MSTEVVKKPKFDNAAFKKPQGLNVLKQMGEIVKSSLAEAMPSFMRNQAQALLRALYTECQKNPKLLDCTPESLFGCTIQVAQVGLMLGSTLGQAYLVPFKGKVTLIIGYKGYIQLVNRSGQVGVISAKTVYDRDIFSVEYGSRPCLIHKPARYGTAEEVRKRVATDYYATCITKQGETFVAMTRGEAEVHRDRFAMAKSDRTPWYTDFDPMAMKTAIIKLCKYLPMSAEIQTAVRIDETNETDQPFDASFLFQESMGIDGSANEMMPPPSKTEQLRGQIAAVTNPVGAQPDPVLITKDKETVEVQTTEEKKPEAKVETPADGYAKLLTDLDKSGDVGEFLGEHNLLWVDVENPKDPARRKELGAMIEKFQSEKFQSLSSLNAGKSPH